MSPTRRLATLLVVAASVALVVPGCKGAKVEGEGRLDPDGRVLLTRDDKATTLVRSRSLVAGDVVEVAEGSAKITLPGGDLVELRPRSVVVLANGPEVRGGSVLVTADGRPRTVRAAGSQVDAAGTIRLDVTLALRVVVYRGRAALRSGGRTVEVPTLREASVPVIGVLPAPRALVIDRADPWDQRLLGEAVTKEPELENLATGFAANVATRNASSVAYYRGLLPALTREAAFQQAEVDRLGRSSADAAQPATAVRFRAGDVLFGAAIALKGKQGGFATRLTRATEFRALGASWSLVCLDQQIDIGDLQTMVGQAINGATLELAAPAPQGTAVVSEPLPARATTTTRPAARTTATTATTRAPRTTATTTPGLQPAAPQQQPGPAPIILPVDALLDAVVDPVAKLLNDLLGAKQQR